MGPYCEMSLHRLNTDIPAEPLVSRRLFSRGVSDPNCDGTTCRTYYTDVVSRWYVFFSWRFNLSGRVKTFPQISHTWRDLLVEEISSSSCKIIRCINDGFTIRFRDTVRQVLFARSCLKITWTIEQSLSSAWFYHSFIYTISCFL